VGDGREALDAAREWRPEVVLLDIGLPGMDGYEVARRLREEPETNSAFLIALTGYGAEDDRQRALNDRRMLEGIRQDAMDSMRRYFLLNCPAGRLDK
jgi:CheY-like chemotaxis protein